ncbi:MAG TPA: SDR family oxidoreductase [Anaerolineaceae bacterium]|nr:SDR family oxidoreductase [Anaerolineaceae bacterium]
MDLHLQGQIVFIAGSSQGLGFAIAKQLLEEKAIVILNGRDKEKLRNSHEKLSQNSEHSVFSFPGDVTDKNFSKVLYDFIETNFGKLDILITNAGGPKPGEFESIDDETWYSAFELSFMSHVRLIRALLPLLKGSSHSNVLTITSYSVKQPIPNLILSNSIRAATVGLTKTLALELGKHGIRFNSILPGWTLTERVKSLMQNRAQINDTTIDEETSKQSQESPLGRMAEPEEFANVATFLVSPRSSYLTGSMISVDGGMVKGIF